jgi:uncharacterized protein (TIGR04255 family)
VAASTDNPAAPDVQFRHPPVVEVVLSVQFEPLHEMTAAHIGLYWAQVKQQFPYAQEHSRLEPIVERYEAPDFNPRFIRVELGEAAPRYWFLNERQSQLLQVQDDRFIHNWRKKVDPYPRYEKIREAFSLELDQFSSFVRSEGIGSVVPRLAEVTYVNHIAGRTDQPYAHPEDVLKVLSYRRPPESDEPETIDTRFRYSISHEGRKVGRLHVELQPATRERDQAPIWLLVLTARGLPLSEDSVGVTQFLDIGRRNMLAIFLAITSERLQEEWELVK